MVRHELCLDANSFLASERAVVCFSDKYALILKLSDKDSKIKGKHLLKIGSHIDH